MAQWATSAVVLAGGCCAAASDGDAAGPGEDAFFLRGHGHPPAASFEGQVVAVKTRPAGAFDFQVRNTLQLLSSNGG